MSRSDLRSNFAWAVKVSLIIAIVVGVSSCFHMLWKDETSAAQVREENGGVIPGKEALDNNGTRYTVFVITYEGNTYTCFSRDYRSLGCAKE